MGIDVIALLYCNFIESALMLLCNICLFLWQRCCWPIVFGPLMHRCYGARGILFNFQFWGGKQILCPKYVAGCICPHFC